MMQYMSTGLLISRILNNGPASEFGYPYSIIYRYTQTPLAFADTMNIGRRICYSGPIEPVSYSSLFAYLSDEPQMMSITSPSSPSVTLTLLWNSNFTVENIDQSVVLSGASSNYTGFGINSAALFHWFYAYQFTFNIIFDTSLADPSVPITGQCTLGSSIINQIFTTFSYDSPPPNGFTLSGSVVTSDDPVATGGYITTRCTLTASNATDLIISPTSTMTMSQFINPV